MAVRDFAKHSGGGKRVPRREREQKLFGRLVLFLGVFFLSSALGILLIFSRARWDGKDTRTLVVVQGNEKDVRRSLALVQFRPQDGEMILVPIPENAMIESLHGFGQYPSSSLHGLMTLEHLPWQYLTQTLSFQFGVFVEDVVYLRDSSSVFSRKDMESGIFNTLFLKEKSSLRYADRIRAWLFLGKLRSDKITTIDLVSSGVVRQDQSLDIVRMDSIFSTLFADSELRRENLEIAVVNTTNEARLGTRIARVLGIVGGNVIHLASSSQNLEKTTVVLASKPAQHSRTVQLLLALMGVDGSTLSMNEEIADQYRAEIVILLGKDAAALFTSGK